MAVEIERGVRVQVNNPKNKKYHGAIGVISDLNRGNVYVLLDNGETICTRWWLLGPPPALYTLGRALDDEEEPKA